MFKLIGDILIILSTTYAGFIYSDKYKKRAAQLNEMERCILQIKNEIIYTHSILWEILDNVAIKAKDPAGKVFKYIADLLKENKVDSTYEAFKMAFEHYKNDIELKSEDINIILDLSKTLGESNVDGQKDMFNLADANLKKQIITSENLMHKYVKMYRCLGFSLGATIVIIFI